MSRTAGFCLIVLIGMAACLSSPRPIAADVANDSSRAAEVMDEDVVSSIRLGMTLKEVNRILHDEPGYFVTGPGIVEIGPEDSNCFYMRAGVVILYKHGRVIHIKRPEGSRARDRNKSSIR